MDKESCLNYARLNRLTAFLQQQQIMEYSQLLILLSRDESSRIVLRCSSDAKGINTSTTKEKSPYEAGLQNCVSHFIKIASPYGDVDRPKTRSGFPRL